MKNTLTVIIVIVVIALVGIGAYVLLQPFPHASVPPTQEATTTAETATTTTAAPAAGSPVVIGTSVQGRDIDAYHYGTGADEILFVGDIGGGYESNTALVAYQLMDYLNQNPGAIPANETVTVVPVLNPDGLDKIVGTTTANFTEADAPALAQTVPGRFNANNVDLDRNFDCDWQATGTWQNTTVSGGTAPFSEPESKAIEAYITAHKPVAAVVWYSAAGGVYSAGCDDVSSATAAITKVYADASGYPAHESFDAYATTGDMANWFAKEGISAISVLLTNHTDTEWSKNQAGIDALLQYYAK